MTRVKLMREDLVALSGQPVFVTDVFGTDGVWCIVSQIKQQVSDGFTIKRHFRDYGKTWVAYNAEEWEAKA